MLARRNTPNDGTASDDGSSPNDGDASDDGGAVEQAIESALQGLRGLDDVPVADHVGRFDTVHTALTEALGRTENHQSGPHGGS